MNNIRFLSFVLTVAALAACQESSHLLSTDIRESTRKASIEFSNYVGAATKASKTSGNSFVAGDEMAVWGDQTTGKDYDELFRNQKVSYVSGETWTYSNKKLWNTGSEYLFYGFFPYMATDPVYEISSMADGRLFKIGKYTTPATNKDQKDLMISERRAVSPFNTVNMIFHHMLSKVDMIFRVSQDFDMAGIDSIELVNFHIEGIRSTGSYEQTAWSAEDMPIGTWTNTDDLLVIEDIRNVSATDNEIKHILDDCLLIPQTLGNDVKFSVSFKIHYSDGTTCTITKDNIILGALTSKNKTESGIQIKSWEPNNSYLYQLVFNPGKNEHGGNTAQPNGCITGDSDDPEHPAQVDIITRDTDGDGEPDEYLVDQDRDGKPDYPLVWDDPDGDGIENLYPDKDGDGKPDFTDTDGDGKPDDLWVDTDGDGDADTEASRKKPGDPNTEIPDPDPDGKPNGCITGDSDDSTHPTDVDIIVDSEGNYWVDEDRDGTPDYPLIWADPDGDGIENLYPDKDKDGKPDYTDTDGDGNPDDLWVDTTADGNADTEVSRTAPGKPNTDIPQYTTTIEFTASVYDWEKDWEIEKNIGETK